MNRPNELKQIRDSFVSKWTGQMSAFILSNGTKITFKKTFRVEKGQGYVLVFDRGTGSTRLYPV